MSKNLVKILSICAFVIILPLAILATALCVTESASYKLKLYIAGVDASNTVASCKVLINGEQRKNNEMTFAKNSEVIITFEDTGYDFTAWKDGTDKTYEAGAKVSDKETYSFKISKNTSLTAVCSLQNYDVTYLNIDGSQFEDKDGNKLAGRNYKYGEVLAIVEEENFGGWLLKGTNQRYARATFEKTGPIELEAYWTTNKVLTYTDVGDKVIYSKQYTREDFDKLSIISAESDVVKNNVAKGYNFVGWVDSNNELIDDLTSFQAEGFTTDELVLKMKVEAIAYTLNIKTHAKSEEVKTVEYDVEKTSLGYEIPLRPHYTFVGLQLGETLYTYNAETGEYRNGTTTLGSAIINGTDTTVELTGVWKAEVEKMSVSIRAYGDDRLTKGLYVLKDEQYLKFNELDKTTLTYNFQDIADGDDLTESIYEVSLAGYESFYILDGTEYKQLTNIKEARIYFNGADYESYLATSASPDFPKKVSFANIINTFKGNNVTITEDVTIEVVFIFG